MRARGTTWERILRRRRRRPRGGAGGGGDLLLGEFEMSIAGVIGTFGGLSLSVSDDGLGNELDLASPLFDFRADDATLVTESGGAVSAITSQNGSGGTITQGTAANRPAFTAGLIQFASTGITDANGDFLALSTGAGSIVQLYSADMEKLGVVYMLLRFPSLPTWGVNLFSILRNNASALNRNAFRCYVSADTGIAGVLRGASAAQQIAALGVGIAANEWTAMAFVLNDDRTTPNTSDHISRIFGKTKAGGAMATMQAASSSALTLTGGTPVAGAIGREEYEDQRTGNWQLHSFAFDADPPTTNGGIEANLNALLARV